jgi:hypothetical protein
LHIILENIKWFGRQYFLFSFKMLSVLFVIQLSFSFVSYAKGHEEQLVNLQCDDYLSFKEISRQISEQTGYDVIFDKSLLEERIFKIRGHNPVDRLLIRLLKGKNYAINFDDAKKEIRVVSFEGSKENSLASVKVKSSYGNDIDNITGRSFQEINKAIALNKNRLTQLVHDPEALEPISGKTYIEIEHSLKQLSAKIRTPEAIDNVSGLPFVSINRSLKKNADNIVSDLAAVDPITGEKYAKMRKSTLEISRYNNGIDPVTGRSYQEINNSIEKKSF